MATLSELKDTLVSQEFISQQRQGAIDAAIRSSSDLRNRVQLRIPLALDTARTDTNPLIIENPFTGFYVEAATDSDVSVKIAFTSDESQNLSQYTTIKKNDSASATMGIFRRALLTWAAQSGKTMTIVFYLGVDLRPGSLNSVITGGVTVITGDAWVSTVVAVSTVTQIVAASSTRKMATIGNPRTSGVDLWIGGANTVDAEGGATPGILLEPGDYYEYRGQGAIYGITTGAVVNVTVQSES